MFGSCCLASVLLASAAPAWIWATLIVAGFVALSVFTMWLAKFPARATPPTIDDERDAMADWQVLRVAPDQLTAEMWVDLLRAEGIAARIKASDAVSFLGTSGLSCRVLVPEDRVAEAEAVLSQEPEPGGDGARGDA